MAVAPPWLPGMGPDSIVPGEQKVGFVIDNPVVTDPVPGVPPDYMSWVYIGLTVLFCIVCFCMHSSPRYWKAVVSDLTDTRERGNVFDETVRETTFLVLLNLLWTVSAGVLLWTAIRWLSPDNPVYSFSVADKPAPGIGICSGMCLLYSAAMLLAYWVSGCVFRDRHQAGMWVRGAAAAPAIETVFLFPVALLVLVRPEWTEVLLLTALCTFAMGKIMFILKGIRIFFNHSSSWLLFLYYLCSLEIVPLILTFVLTLDICVKWL